MKCWPFTGRIVSNKQHKHFPTPTHTKAMGNGDSLLLIIARDNEGISSQKKTELTSTGGEFSPAAITVVSQPCHK